MIGAKHGLPFACGLLVPRLWGKDLGFQDASHTAHAV